MKRKYSLVLLFLIANTYYCRSQELLINGDFEILTVEEIGLSTGGNLTNWEVLTGSPDIFDEIIYKQTDPRTAKSGRLFLNLLVCESIYQPLTKVLLPKKQYNFSFQTQSYLNTFFPPDNLDGCGGSIFVFVASKNLENVIQLSDCPTDAASNYNIITSFRTENIEEDCSTLQWCFSPQDTIRYIGIGVELAKSCNNFAVLIDNASLIEVSLDEELDGFSLNDTLLICPGEDCREIKVDVPANLVWNDGYQGNQRQICETGKYEISYELAGCNLTEELIVQNSNFHSNLLQDNMEICQGECIEIQIDTTYQLIWNDGFEGNRRMLCQIGLYQITYEVEECRLTEQLVVKEEICPPPSIYTPNAFSPNDDGNNDYWEVLFDPKLKDDLTESRLLIFDKWGNLLIKKNRKNLGWDGKFNGKEMPSDIYLFVLTYRLWNNPKTIIKTGDIMLLR